jgi:2-polyprenyl-6-methoxyphenol hydroxylase-like FAD-dependent oxidoreductase
MNVSKTVESDVLVVGAGVAGATTARLLAEGGHRVVLLDRARFPRDKPCGEGVMPTGVRLLDRLGVLAKIPAEQRHVLRGVGFVVDGRDRIRGDFPDVGGGFDRGLGVKRLVLDHHLLEHARAHPGVEVHEGEPATDVRWPDGRFAEVCTPALLYRARVVVGADGARSLVRRKLGLEKPRGARRRYGMRAHFTFPRLAGARGRPLGDYVTVYRDPAGECYTTPVSDTELEVALTVERERMGAFAGRLESAFDDYLHGLPHLRAAVGGGERTSAVLACGPFDVWARSRVAARAVLVGDAGGYLDPITGEGISLALQGACWAAGTIDAALRLDDLSAARLRPYHVRVERALRHYKALTRVVLYLCRHGWLAGLLVRRLACCPGLYSSLMAINCGVQTFWDLRPEDLLRLLLGRAPGSTTPCACRRRPSTTSTSWTTPPSTC